MGKGFNGKHIWIAILVVVFIIIVISTYNRAAKQNQENAKNQASTQNTQAKNETFSYENTVLPMLYRRWLRKCI